MLSGNIIKSTEEVVNELQTLDLYCDLHKTSGELLLLGGTAFLVLLELLNSSFRSTRDIDIKILSSTDEAALINAIREARFDLILGTVDIPPPEDFKNQKKYLLEIPTLKNIKVYVPTAELLVCTKLFSKRDKDLRDLMETDIIDFCDQKTLIDLVDEYKLYVLNPNDSEWNFLKLSDIFAKMGI